MCTPLLLLVPLHESSFLPHLPLFSVAPPPGPTAPHSDSCAPSFSHGLEESWDSFSLFFLPSVLALNLT